MKLTSSLLAALGFLGPREAVAGAVPAGSGSSSTAGLEARDKYCRLHDDVGPPGHCRTCASRTCESIRNIKKSDRFGVKCRMFGDTVNNIEFSPSPRFSLSLYTSSLFFLLSFLSGWWCWTNTDDLVW
jgi:hypothetical protein